MNRKIEIFTRRRFKSRDTDVIVWQYHCSTVRHATCKEARRVFCERFGLSEDQVKASFAPTK
jgi:hypothetical protein